MYSLDKKGHCVLIIEAFFLNVYGFTRNSKITQYFTLFFVLINLKKISITGY